MKNFSAAYAAHLQQPVTTLSVCWRVLKNNGTVVLGTEHDRDIVISETNIGMDIPSVSGFDPFTLVGTYRARAGITSSQVKLNSDMSVNSAEVLGALAREPDLLIDVSVPDVEAGLYESAQITTFRVNWQDPNDFQDILQHGFMGQVDWNSDREYRTEVRGLTQVLQQVIGRTAGDSCDVVEFGDHRCKFDVESRAIEGVVTAVTNSRRFDVDFTIDSSTEPADLFALGKLTMLTGENATYVRQIKNIEEGGSFGELLLWDPLPLTVQVGDLVRAVPGCPRTIEACKFYENFVNFRGPGLFMPGTDKIVRAP